MKRLMREMTECHARATHGPDYDTWHEGRFLDQWADPRAVAGLTNAYAHYEESDVRRALWATMELFRWLSVETAERLGASERGGRLPRPSPHVRLSSRSSRLACCARRRCGPA